MLSDFAPSARPFTVGDLLAHAERVAADQPEAPDAGRVEMLIAIGRQYQLLEEHEKARAILARAYVAAQTVPDGPTRAKTACALAGVLARTGEHTRAEALIREADAELPAEPHVTLHRIYCLMRGCEVARVGNDITLALDRIENARRLAESSAIPSALMQLSLAMLLADPAASPAAASRPLRRSATPRPGSRQWAEARRPWPRPS